MELEFVFLKRINHCLIFTWLRPLRWRLRPFGYRSCGGHRSVPEEILGRGFRRRDLSVHLDPAAVTEVNRAAVRLVTLFGRAAFVLVSPDEEERRGQRDENEDHGEQDDERRGERLGRRRIADHRQAPLELFEVGDCERPGLALHDDVAGRLEVDLYVMR